MRGATGATTFLLLLASARTFVPGTSPPAVARTAPRAAVPVLQQVPVTRKNNIAAPHARGTSSRPPVAGRGARIGKGGRGTLPKGAPDSNNKKNRAVEAALAVDEFARSGGERNATLLYERATRLLQTYHTKEAIQVLLRLTALSPEDGRVWMKLMSTYKRQRKYREAEETIRRGIHACPRNAKLRQALADLCREGKRYEEARQHFRAAMKVDSRLTSVYDSWGRMEAALGENVRATSLFQKGLELQPSARLCHALGVLLDTQGLSEAARKALRRGLSLPHEAANPQLLHALGMVEVRAGNHAAARSHFSSAVKEHPAFTLAYLSLGQLEERLGNKAAARRHYEAGATARQPTGQTGAVQLWQSWARMEQRLGDSRAAMRLYERAHALFPEDQQLLVEWAKLCAEHGDATRARKLYKTLIADKRRPPTPYAFQCAAGLEASAGNVEAARALFKRGAASVAAPPKRLKRALGRGRGGVLEAAVPAAATVPATADGAASAGATASDQLMPMLHAWAVFEWREGERRKAKELFRRAEAAAPGPCGWLYQWHARFEADGGSLALARHYYARAVNEQKLDSTAWRLWAELEEQRGDPELALTLSRHAQTVETEACLLDAMGSGTRKASSRNPLSRSDMYNYNAR